MPGVVNKKEKTIRAKSLEVSEDAGSPGKVRQWKKSCSVLISYAQEQRIIAELLKGQLKNAGFEPQMTEGSVTGGTVFHFPNKGAARL